jgi:hypothetical protein
MKSWYLMELEHNVWILLIKVGSLMSTLEESPVTQRFG